MNSSMAVYILIILILGNCKHVRWMKLSENKLKSLDFVRNMTKLAGILCLTYINQTILIKCFLLTLLVPGSTLYYRDKHIKGLMIIYKLEKSQWSMTQLCLVNVLLQTYQVCHMEVLLINYFDSDKLLRMFLKMFNTR